jgi:two-component system, OmpR family, sensor histidine kinase CpxA
MRSLFFKIFIIFWIAQSLIFVISTSLIVRHRFPRSANILDPAFGSLRVEASQALKAYDDDGCRGFQAFSRDRHEDLSLVDDTGRTVCGDTVEIPQLDSSGAVSGRQTNSGTVWTFPVTSANGRTYRFVDSVRHEHRTWYGDILHFAFPQLPVAIAIGGLTTLLLVMIFTRPVIQLREAARKLARGELGARVSETHAGSFFKDDEFQGLVHDFNHMAERLQSLVDAQKLLLRDVSHELRSPLARVNVALELSREDADSTMSAHLDRIQRETERLNQLIGQLLTLSSMEAAENLGTFERVSLNSLLKDMLPDAEYEAQQRETGIDFQAQCECVVEGRRELLYRAIENVIRNAIRYTESKSHVEIRLRNDAPAHMALLEVSDRGPGIPESELESIFRPFYRLDQARNAQTGGFGVGLAIAERAVKLHNGQIRALNRAGGGTTIQISVPVAV